MNHNKEKEQTQAEAHKNDSDETASVEDPIKKLENYSRELELQNAELNVFKERLSAAMMAGDVAWWQMDVKTGTVEFSENKARVLGYPAGQFKHYNDFMKLVHPDDADATIDAMRACLRGEKEFLVDYRIFTVNKETLYFHDVGTISAQDEDGSPLIISGVTTNVSKYWRAQHTAEENEKKLRALIDFLPMGLTIADSSGKILGANKRAEKLLGLPSKDQSQRDIDGAEWEIIRRDGSLKPAEEYPSVRALQENKLVKDVEMGLKKPDGTTAWLQVSATPTGITDFDLVIAYQDISRLVEQENSLFTNAQTLRLYLDNIPQPMILTDFKGEITKVNQAFCELYGYTPDEILGKRPNILNPGLTVYKELGYTDDTYNQLFSSLWKEISDQDRGEWHGVVVNRKKEGSLVWVDLRIKTLYNPQNEISNFIGLPMDISSYRDLADKGRIELYETIARLSELRDNETGNHMRRVGLFSKMLARDLGQVTKYCDDIEVFAPMHDIGKVGISDSILLAPRKLSHDEFEQMKTHAILGHNIVKGKPEMELAAALTWGHHEWWDGTGYPQGLRGEDIPLSARITALCDVYDALRSRRPYKDPWSHEDTVKEILSKSGTQFDPKIVESFKRLQPKFKAIFRELEDQ